MLGELDKSASFSINGSSGDLSHALREGPLRRLIEDLFVRRLAQILLLASLGLLAFLQLVFVVLLFGREHNLFPRVPGFEDFVLSFLAFPFEKNFSSFAVLAGIIPVMFSTVCFLPDLKAAPPTATDNMNRVGHAALLLLAVGGIFGATSIAMAGLSLPDSPAETTGDLIAMAGSKDAAIAIRNTLSAIFGFEAFYVAQLVGLKK
jgi:hypothetical protein